MRSFHTSRLVGLAALLCSGCYAYAHTPVAELPPGRDVRVTLTDQATTDLTPQLGPRAGAVSGTISTRSDSGVDLRVTEVTRLNGTDETWPGERLFVPRIAVADATVRRMSRGRSIVTAVGVAAAAILVGRGLGGGSNIPGRAGGGSGNEQ